MKSLNTIAILLMFAIASSAGFGVIQAQPAQTAIKRVAVHPRALITQVEIAEYRRAISTARSRAEKQAIREATYATLRQRAESRGMIMAEPHPWYGGLHWGELGYQTRQQAAVVKTPEIIPAPISVTPHVATQPVMQHVPVKPVSPPRVP